jgi:hypothetical protein
VTDRDALKVAMEAGGQVRTSCEQMLSKVGVCGYVCVCGGERGETVTEAHSWTGSGGRRLWEVPCVGLGRQVLRRPGAM